MLKKTFKKISPYEWEIPRTYRSDMRVAVRLFVTERLLEAALDDLSLEQAVNVATLPGLVGPVVVMPDVHQGYGFPIGGVAATEFPQGVISPGGIGYDINCGVRLLSSMIEFAAAQPYLEDLAAALNTNCPSGMGKAGPFKLKTSELEAVCRLGAEWALKKGMAGPEDLRRTEETGCVDGADPRWVSEHAKTRGSDQLGTLGSGNHFMEVDVVEQIFDPDAAQAMGLVEGCLTLQFHCGSRGFGHQVCSDYVQQFQSAVRRYGIQLPDRELVCAPMDSPEGQHYLAAMRSAANFAFCNRQILAHMAQRAFEQVLAGKIRQYHMERSYGSTCHGAGRVMSRSKAKRDVRGERLRDELEQQGIHIRAGSLAGLAEEAPQAYKDVDDVVETVSGAGIARKVARLRPVVVVKG